MENDEKDDDRSETVGASTEGAAASTTDQARQDAAPVSILSYTRQHACAVSAVADAVCVYSEVLLYFYTQRTRCRSIIDDDSFAHIETPQRLVHEGTSPFAHGTAHTPQTFRVIYACPLIRTLTDPPGAQQQSLATFAASPRVRATSYADLETALGGGGRRGYLLCTAPGSLTHAPARLEALCV